MKILVTGGLGFVGYPLVKNLIAEGHEVHALGRTINPPKEKILSDFSIILLISQAEAFRFLVQRYGYSIPYCGESRYWGKLQFIQDG